MNRTIYATIYALILKTKLMHNNGQNHLELSAYRTIRAS